MLLICTGHTYKYECEKICRVFFPAEKVVFGEADAETAPRTVWTAVSRADGLLIFSCKADLDGRVSQKSETVHVQTLRISEEMALARVMLDVFCALTGIVPPWGVLTGVRPSKLYRSLTVKSGEQTAADIFTRDLKVRPDKARLVSLVSAAEERSVALSTDRSFSLYISIPFCPTRCSYCSFVSHSIASAKKLIPDYVRLLCREIGETGRLAQELGLRLETVYFGGGTPTSLDAEALAAITGAIAHSFDLSAIREYTVEAGRPDTVDGEKLMVLKNAGVGRISVNPQTFSDDVLRGVGRCHTAAETIEKFRLARKIGFDNINMDLIAGLPGDTPAGFRQSLETAVSLSPENITVHTLALKSAARLVTEGVQTENDGATAEMVEFASGLLFSSGYAPYYMYRQSKSLGNLENVGWTKPGCACLYNIYMMEEVHTVLAAGAGAVTKLRDPKSDYLERIYNFKYPYEYISRFDEMLARKARIGAFYGQEGPGMPPCLGEK